MKIHHENQPLFLETPNYIPNFCHISPELKPLVITINPLWKPPDWAIHGCLETIRQQALPQVGAGSDRNALNGPRERTLANCCVSFTQGMEGWLDGLLGLLLIVMKWVIPSFPIWSTFHAGNGWEWGNGTIINSSGMGHSLIPDLFSTSIRNLWVSQSRAIYLVGSQYF